MGLFSSGNKDDIPRRGASRGNATRGERPSRRRAPQEAMLDPTLPEKQRARRRLVGAIALVLAAVIILPMVLDSHPKPVTDDIAISIPDSGDTGAASATSRAAAQSVAADDTAAPPSRPAQPALHGGAASAAVTVPPVASVAPPAPIMSPAPVPVAPPAATATANTHTTDDTATPGSRFVVQLGSFASDAPANIWVGKLKALGVTAYVQHVKQANGSQRVLLRAGPFADRGAAEAAVRKVRAAGLAAQPTGAQG